MSEKSASNPIEKISALDVRVAKLETYWYVTVALAAILGVGGGWIGVRLSELEAKSPGRSFKSEANNCGETTLVAADNVSINDAVAFGSDLLRTMRRQACGPAHRSARAPPRQGAGEQPTSVVTLRSPLTLREGNTVLADLQAHEVTLLRVKNRFY